MQIGPKGEVQHMCMHMYVIAKYRRAKSGVRCADPRKARRRELHFALTTAPRAAGWARRAERQLGSLERPSGSGHPHGDPRTAIPVKALDSSALLALLEGDRAALELVRRLRGVEVATTEANLLELSFVAARGPARLRHRRLEAIERLRHKLTVLPIDSRAVGLASRHLGKGGERLPPLTTAMLGSLEGGGCDELYTCEPGLSAKPWKLRVSRIGRRETK
jgi:predicted nucleic acid-binding protein